MLTRRHFSALAAVSALAACAPRQPVPPLSAQRAAAPPEAPLPDFYGAITDEPFPIPAIEPGTLAEVHWRQEVANPFPDQPVGTIVVDPDARTLHLVESAETARRYGASVGAVGFGWDGTARLQFTRDWPRWNVPEEMIERRPELEPYSVANGGMDPGPDNPMGARALYLFQDGVDTLYRIHGGAEARHIGRAVSSGCIRLLDQDAIDLEGRAPHGATVIVLPSTRPASFDPVY